MSKPETREDKATRMEGYGPMEILGFLGRKSYVRLGKVVDDAGEYHWYAIVPLIGKGNEKFESMWRRAVRRLSVKRKERI